MQVALSTCISLQRIFAVCWSIGDNRSAPFCFCSVFAVCYVLIPASDMSRLLLTHVNREGESQDSHCNSCLLLLLCDMKITGRTDGARQRRRENIVILSLRGSSHSLCPACTESHPFRLLRKGRVLFSSLLLLAILYGSGAVSFLRIDSVNHLRRVRETQRILLREAFLTTSLLPS